jgi:hypothetical protein
MEIVMAKKRGVRITILVEDETLERFARGVLLEFGFSRHELRVISYPVGKGSMKDWVENQYPDQVKTLRSKAYQQIGLLVGTDADENTVQQRMNKLAEALQNANMAAREDNERIVLWVPRWNVETWILHFLGDTRDEDTNYKAEVKKPNFVVVAQAFVEEYREWKGDDTIATLPSLTNAYSETQRFEL